MPQRFPAQTVRDPISIARLLYRNPASREPQRRAAARLVAIGRDLQATLTLAAASVAGTRLQRDAWELVQSGTVELTTAAHVPRP